MATAWTVLKSFEQWTFFDTIWVESFIGSECFTSPLLDTTSAKCVNVNAESMKAVKSSVYSAAVGLLLRGTFGVSARKRPLSFGWRFTADHRTQLHWQDAHDNRSFCLFAIAISFRLIEQPYGRRSEHKMKKIYVYSFRLIEQPFGRRSEHKMKKIDVY